MKKTILLLLLLTLVLITSCEVPPAMEMAEKYTGTWIARDYDFVDGTAEDYTVSDLSTAVNENKTYKIILSSTEYIQYNKAGTLKLKISVDMLTENSFIGTVVDEGLENLKLGDKYFWELEEGANSEILIKTYSTSKKETYWATYRCGRTES